jgi:sodium-dependent phosphate transporter
MSDTKPFLWILITGFITSFLASIGIGANDVANSFATSVGARVLTLRQATIIASVCEFSGAVLLGSHVTDTIRKKIVKPSTFDDEPYVLMYGMLCASIASGIWLAIATYLKWPVSTTHSIIGAVVGFALVYDADSVDTGKILEVVISWVISPLLAGVLTMLLLGLNINLVLKHKNAIYRAKIWMPFMVALTVMLIVMFVIYKGSPQLDLDELEFSTALWISIVIAIISGIGTFISIKYSIFTKLNNYIKPLFEKCTKRKTATITTEETTQELTEETTQELTEETNVNVIETDIDNIVETQPLGIENKMDGSPVKVLHISKYESEKFTKMVTYDDEAETLYSWLQVFTAIISSFAHGSNDIANSIAPIAAMYSIYNDGNLQKKSDVPVWLLAVGAVGMIIGLSIWGWRIIGRMGSELSGVTPTRGVSIELGAAVTVLIASRLEIPVSTTHCQVGSIVGSGLVDSIRKDGCSFKTILSGKLPNVDLRIFGKIIFAWVVTLPVTISLSAALFAFGHESP